MKGRDELIIKDIFCAIGCVIAWFLVLTSLILAVCRVSHMTLDYPLDYQIIVNCSNASAS